MSDMQTEVDELRLEVARLRSEIAATQEQAQRQLAEVGRELGDRAAPAPSSSGPAPAAQHGQPQSRRTLLKSGVAAAAAAAAATQLRASPAAATDGDALIVGQTNTSASGISRLNATGTGQITNGNVFTAADGDSGSLRPAAVGAFAFGNRVRNGLYAFTSSRDNDNVETGHGVIVRILSNARSHLRLEPSGTDPRLHTFVHGAGSMRMDTSGNLWCCVSGGTPGVWRKLTGTAAAGTFHGLNPTRVHDSRITPFFGLIGGQSLTLSVADGRDVDTGAVTTPNVVPAGATSIAFNLTITETTEAGFVAITPGDAATFGASTINWSQPGTTLANGSMTALDADRQVKVFVIGGFTHFVLDITGYWL